MSIQEKVGDGKTYIIQCTDDIHSTVEQMERNLDPSCKLWVAVDITKPKFTEYIVKCANIGFANPAITNENPLRQIIPHSIALIKPVNGAVGDFKSVIVNVRYLLKQYKKHGCSMRVKFSDEAIAFLKQTSKMGHTKNKDHSISQKEMAGALHVDKIIEEKGTPLFIIGCAESKVEHGVEEEVNVSATRYNFHSHPEEAYKRHKVTVAWPSLTDYLGYLKLGNNTIFHCVATLEGLYILSFSEEWVGKINKIKKSFIQKNYDIDHNEKLSPYQYMEKINHILYKGAPIFIVKYLPWNQASHTIFSVSYKKEGVNCRTSDM